jgi:hypothetical protein
VNVDADISSLDSDRLARVDSHTDTHSSTGWPRVGGDGLLRGYSCSDGICGARKSYEGFFPAGIYLISTALVESGTEQFPAFR